MSGSILKTMVSCSNHFHTFRLHNFHSLHFCKPSTSFVSPLKASTSLLYSTYKFYFIFLWKAPIKFNLFILTYHFSKKKKLIISQLAPRQSSYFPKKAKHYLLIYSLSLPLLLFKPPNPIPQINYHHHHHNHHHDTTKPQPPSWQPQA